MKLFPHYTHYDNCSKCQLHFSMHSPAQFKQQFTSCCITSGCSCTQAAAFTTSQKGSWSFHVKSTHSRGSIFMTIPDSDISELIRHDETCCNLHRYAVRHHDSSGLSVHSRCRYNLILFSCQENSVTICSSTKLIFIFS